MRFLSALHSKVAQSHGPRTDNGLAHNQLSNQLLESHFHIHIFHWFQEFENIGRPHISFMMASAILALAGIPAMRAEDPEEDAPRERPSDLHPPRRKSSNIKSRISSPGVSPVKSSPPSGFATSSGGLVGMPPIPSAAPSTSTATAGEEDEAVLLLFPRFAQPQELPLNDFLAKMNKNNVS